MRYSLQMMLATLGIAAVFGTAAPAAAATLATGVLETATGTQIRCSLANVSAQPMTYRMCSVNILSGSEFICDSGTLNAGRGMVLIAGSSGGAPFYCRFTVSNRSAAHATASITNFNGTPFAVIDAR